MKKILLLTALLSAMLALLCMAVYAGGEITLRATEFEIDGESVYTVSQGKASARLCIENTSGNTAAATIYIAAYEGNRLTDISCGKYSLTSGVAFYNVGYVEASEAADAKVNVFVWDDMMPLTHAASLDSVSCDASLKAFDLEVAGKTYSADIDMFNSGTLSVECAYSGTNPVASVTDSCAPSVAVVQGAQVSPASGTAVDLIGGTTYTVTAPNGNKAVYDIRLSQMQLGWSEGFTGSYISGANDKVNNKDYAGFAPSYGTWRGGMSSYLSDGWGHWRSRTSNDNIRLAINNDTQPSANDFLSMTLHGSASDMIYYTLKNPLPTAGAPLCQRLVFSFDFRGEDISNGIYGWLGNFVSGFLIVKTPDGNLAIKQRVNGADASPDTVAEVSMNEWHNLKLIAAKTATGFDVEYFVDKKHVYTHDMSRKYTYLGNTTTGMISTENLITMLMLSGESGRFDIDNCYALFTREGAEAAAELQVQLQRLRNEYDDAFISWLASMYDPVTGGFYYSASARDYEGFETDIESTSQALNIMETSCLKPSSSTFTGYLGTDFRNKIVSYIQSRQDSESGYFYDPQFSASSVGVTKRERNLSQAKVMLQRFGASPLYPYPTSQQSTMQTMDLPQYLQSAENFDAWMRALPWETSPYAAANQLGSQQYTAANLGYTDMIIDFLKSIQDSSTGLWGNGLNYEAINASLKVSPYFNTDTEPYPYADKMVKSLIYILNTTNTPPQTASETWNPFTLINYARVSYGGAFTADVKKSIDTNMPMMVKWAVDALEVFKKPDGGFSYCRQKSTPYSQGAPVSMGLAESDMNASMLLLNLWEKCYNALGQSAPVLFGADKSAYFLNLINNVQTPVKSMPPSLVYSESFETITNNTILETTWTISNPDRLSIVSQGDKGNVLVINTSSSDETATTAIGAVAVNKSNPSEITFSADIKLSNISGTTLFANSFGDTALGNAVQWLLVAKDGGYTVNHRSSGSGYGTAMGGVLTLDKWYGLKIIYKPDGADNTQILYYIDDTLVGTTNQYSGYGQRNPVSTVNCLNLNSSIGSTAKLFIDNIRIVAE